MLRRLSPALTLLMALACKPPSPSSPEPVAGPDARPDAVDAVDVVDAAPPVDAAPAAVRAEACAGYVDHVLALGLAAMRTNRPDELVPTDAQVAEIRTRLIATDPCRELTPPTVACAMAATTQPALYACVEARPPAPR